MRTVDAQAKPVNIQCELWNNLITNRICRYIVTYKSFFFDHFSKISNSEESLLLWFLSKKFLYYFTLYVLFLQTSRNLCSNAKADILRLFCNIETRRLSNFSSISQDDSTESALIANSPILCLPSCNQFRTKQTVYSAEKKSLQQAYIWWRLNLSPPFQLNHDIKNAWNELVRDLYLDSPF